MGPRLVAFAASLLFSRGLTGVVCRKYPREAQVFSGSPVDIHLAEISIPECSVHESCCGLAPFSSVEHYRQPSTFMYIGSTSQSVFRRESNRLSVAKKLLTGGEAQAELAIRYWVSNDCLQDFTLFLVTPCSSYRQAWVTEHCLIGMWQPKLNHPYITSCLRRSALGFSAR